VYKQCTAMDLVLLSQPFRPPTQETGISKADGNFSYMQYTVQQ